MCAGQRLKECAHARSENDASPGKAILSALPTSLTYMEVGCDIECRRPQKTGVRCVSERTNSELSIVRVMEDDELDRHEPDCSSLRDPQFETAVDKIITGIDKSVCLDMTVLPES